MPHLFRNMELKGSLEAETLFPENQLGAPLHNTSAHIYIYIHAHIIAAYD